MWNIFKEMLVRNKIRKETAKIDKIRKQRESLRAKQRKATEARELAVKELSELTKQ